MKKFASYVLVFVLGFGACAYILTQVGALSVGSKESVMQALSGRSSSPVVKKGQNPIADAAARVGPAVVNIDTVAERRISNPFGGIQDFFGQQIFPNMPEKEIQYGKGSGVIISKDGYILTNNHVVAGAQDIKATLADGRKFKARLVGRDSETDLAILKVNAKDLPYAELGDSDAIRVGDWAIAVGNPLGIGHTVTVGVISAINRTLPIDNRGKVIKEAIQTDAAINRGNSGGALANIAGEVIGINTLIVSTEPGQGNIGIGFAIPINSAKGIVKQLIEHGKISRPYLGVTVADLNGDLAAWYKQNGYTPTKGAVIWEVTSGSPAAKAHLMQGDIITKLDKTKIGGAEDVTKAIKKCKVGQVVRLSVWREGKIQLFGVKIGEVPQDM